MSKNQSGRRGGYGCLGLVCLVVGAASGAGCTRPRPAASPSPPIASRDVATTAARLILDQANGGGTRGFIWIAPMVPTTPSGFTTLDTTGIANGLSIRVDRLFADSTVAAATSFSGAGVTLVTTATNPSFPGVTGPFYGANWATGTTVATGDIYRVSVQALSNPTRVLGEIDVLVVANAAAGALVDRTKRAFVVVGATLPIVFRLESKDADGDLLNDWRDNCPFTKNANQLDSDGDGKGDACQCLNAPNGKACSTGCRTGQTCQAGACSGGSAVANDTLCATGNPCKMAETCSAGACGGGMNRGGGALCTTGNPCKMNEVCSAGVCGGMNKGGGTLCASGNPCKAGETCSFGVCGGGTPLTGPACTTGNACRTGQTCSSGVCGGGSTLGNGVACGDGNPCTQTDTCQSGVCTGGSPVACTADGCHLAGACDTRSGTCPARQPDGTSCNDGVACTTGDACQAGTCGAVLLTLTWTNGTAPSTDRVLEKTLDIAGLQQAGCSGSSITGATVDVLEVKQTSSGSGTTTTWTAVPFELSGNTLAWYAAGTTAPGATRTFVVKPGTPSVPTAQFPQQPIVVSGALGPPGSDGFQPVLDPSVFITTVASGRTDAVKVEHAQSDTFQGLTSGGVVKSVSFIGAGGAGTDKYDVHMVEKLNRKSNISGTEPSYAFLAPTTDIKVLQGPLRTVVKWTGSFFYSGTELRPAVTYQLTYHRGSNLVLFELDVPAQPVGAPYDAGSSFAELQMTGFGAPSTWQAWFQGTALPVPDRPPPPPPGQPGVSVATQVTSAEVGDSPSWALVSNAKYAIGYSSPYLDGLVATNQDISFGLAPRPAPYIGQPLSSRAYVYFGASQAAGAAPIDALKSVDREIIAVSVAALAPQITDLQARFDTPGSAGDAIFTAAAALFESARARAADGQEIARAQELLAAATATLDTPLFDCNQSLCVSQTAAFVAAASGHVGLVFKRDAGRVSLDNVVHGPHRLGFMTPALAARPFWRVEMRDSPGGQLATSASEAYDRFTATTTSDEIDLDLHWPASPRQPGTTVTVAIPRGTLGPAVLNDPTALTRWRIDVPGIPGAGNLWQVTFPIVDGLTVNARAVDDWLAYPLKAGFSWRHPRSSLAGSYPSNDATMQLMPYWQLSRVLPFLPPGTVRKSGLYLAAHDRAANVKVFTVEPSGWDSARLAIDNPVPNRGEAGAEYRAAGGFDVMLGAFDGDWYDAAKTFYRRWVLGDGDPVHPVPWLPPPVRSNEQIPDWFKQSTINLRAIYSAVASADDVANLATSLGSNAPVMVQLYDWLDQAVQPGSCKAAPTLTPAARLDPARTPPPLLLDTQKWRARNVMPIFWELYSGWDDLNDAGFAGDPARYYPEPGVPGLRNGECGDGTYKNVAMDSSTPVWADRQVAEVSKIAAITDARGAYLDVAATGAGQLCMRHGHGHDFIGGGHHFVDGNRALMARVRNQARVVQDPLNFQDWAFITEVEGDAEPYLDVSDARIMFTGVSPRLLPIYVPMFQAVYGEYVRFGGSKTGIDPIPNSLADRHPSVESAYTYVMGSPVGRVFWDPLPADSRVVNYVRKLARYREMALPFMAYGETLRPLEVRFSQSQTILDAAGVAVLTTSWRAQDGRVAFLFVSTTSADVGDGPTPYSVTIDPNEYGIATGGYFLKQITPTSITDLGPVTGAPITLNRMIDPSDVQLLIAEPNPINLALGAVATQSSTAFRGFASFAVDGDTVTRTTNAGNSNNLPAPPETPWLDVDLGGIHAIDTIYLYSDGGPPSNLRDRDLYVFVSDVPFTSRVKDETLAQPGVLSHQITGVLQPGANSVAVGRTGRYIRVQNPIQDTFYLAELQAIGHRLPGTAP